MCRHGNKPQRKREPRQKHLASSIPSALSMENKSSALDYDGTTPHNTVFVDTSLDTHLAMTISDSETVSTLKKKIMYEHPFCFPNIGEINIHALKVKRKGYFYHLSDSMFVKGAFDGVSKSWFLSVDASSLEEQRQNEHSQKPNSGDIVACFDMTNNPSTEEKEKENDNGRRKRKKRSSKSISQVVATAPSTEDDRGENSLDMVGVPKNLERDPDAAGVLGLGVLGAMASEPCFISVKENSCGLIQELGENSKVTHSSDVDMSAVDAVNVKSKNNSPEVAADSAVERERVSQDLQTVAAEGLSPIVVQEANNLKKDIVFSKNDDAIFYDGQNLGSDQFARVAEKRELSNDNDPNAIPSKCITSDRDEINMNSKVDVNSDLFNANANVASGKSSKKRKKSKKTRDPVASGTEHIISSIIGISSAVPHEPAHKDHSSDKSRKDESILSPVVGEEEALKTTLNTSSWATVRETDNVIRNVLESLQDISKNSVDVENRNEKSRRKTKRKRNTTSKSLSAMPTEDDVNCKNATPSVNDVVEVEVDMSSKFTKKTKLAKSSSKNHLNGSNRDPENNAVVEANPEGINEWRPLQDLHSDVPKSDSTVKANNHAEISCGSDKTIVNDNFVPSEHKPGILDSDEMFVDKVIMTKGEDKVVKAGKDKKRLDVNSNGPSPDMQTSLKLYENEGNGGKAQAFNSSTVEPQRLLSRADGDSLKLQAKTKLPKFSGSVARASPSNKSDKYNKEAEEAARANAVGATGTLARSNKNKKTVAASTSSLESSKRFLPKRERGNGHQSHVEMRKLSTNNDNGEVVDGSKPKKSLLAASGAIFKDDSDGGSDEERVDSSDSSTRTPNNSSSSDYSDGGSNAQENGSYSTERKKSARRNITKSHSSVKLDTILRHSSRYKAAKLTASQSQLQDTESQPDEFVPDSQANL